MTALSSKARRKNMRWLQPNRPLGFSKSMLASVKDSFREAAGFSAEEIISRVQDIRQTASQHSLQRESFSLYCGMVASQVERSFGFKMHDVQIQAMLAGFTGSIVEMQTGEGKTVVTAAMAAVSCLQHAKVHVATTNDYLAQRDYELVQPVFEGLGIKSGLLPSGHDVAQAQSAYDCTITYGPGYQFGFDFLRDQVYLRSNRQSRLGQRTANLIRGFNIESQLMQKIDCHNIMIVDEADSVMIDEAVTPLVISGAARGDENPEPFLLADQLASRLELDKDYTIKLPEKSIEVNEKALNACHDAIEHRDLSLSRPWRLYIRNAVRAQQILHRNVDYVVDDDEVKIVDQYTGRIFDDRTWQDGLHQAVEAKEKLVIKSAPPSVARITRQRYFQRYDQLAGLTGTARQIEFEFNEVYRSQVVCIPTNLPCIRTVEASRFFADREAKIEAVVQSTLDRHRTGQPVLVGTRNIEESKAVYEKLISKGTSAVVLNGLQDKEEADIIAVAGQKGAITIATNMAGRGTDIHIPQECLELGGLHVVGFSPNDSYRIDRQLAGRSARQGRPGSVQFFVAADDETLQMYAPALGKKIARRCDSRGESSTSFSKQVRALQENIEKTKYETRKSMTRQDKWMDQIRETIDKE